MWSLEGLFSAETYRVFMWGTGAGGGYKLVVFWFGWREPHQGLRVPGLVQVELVEIGLPSLP